MNSMKLKIYFDIFTACRTAVIEKNQNGEVKSRKADELILIANSLNIRDSWCELTLPEKIKKELNKISKKGLRKLRIRRRED